MNATFGPCRGRWPELATDATNKKTPRRLRRGALGRNPGWGLAVGGEVAAIGLLETGRFALGRHLPEYCGIHGGDNVAELGPMRGR